MTPHFNRRRLLQYGAAAAGAALLPGALAQRNYRINPPAMFDNEDGGYRILPSGTVFSGGVVPMPGHEIVHALVKPWMPLKDAWGFIEAYLKSIGRPVKALCGMELRIPAQLTLDGFRTFNTPYAEQLQKWGLMAGRYAAVARTNVVPAVDTPSEASVHAFSYCMPSDTKAVTFCLSGAADVDQTGRPVAEGDISPAGMKRRLEHVVEVISGRLAEIEMEWSHVTHTDLCVVQDIPGLWQQVLAPGLAPAARHGVRVHLARPPIVGTEVELECRAVRQEVTVGA